MASPREDFAMNYARACARGWTLVNVQVRQAADESGEARRLLVIVSTGSMPPAREASENLRWQNLIKPEVEMRHFARTTRTRARHFPPPSRAHARLALSFPAPSRARARRTCQNLTFSGAIAHARTRGAGATQDHDKIAAGRFSAQYAREGWAGRADEPQTGWVFSGAIARAREEITERSHARACAKGGNTERSHACARARGRFSSVIARAREGTAPRLLSKVMVGGTVRSVPRARARPAP